MTKKEKKHLYYLKNKEEILRKSREYNLLHKDELKSKNKIYRDANIQSININRAKRRSTMEGAIAKMYSKAKYRASSLGLDFNIEIEDIIIPEICPLLEMPIDLIQGKGKSDGCASLDRIDNSKGYIKGNIIVLSLLGNVMKNKATVEQLLSFSRNIKGIIENPQVSQQPADTSNVSNQPQRLGQV